MRTATRLLGILDLLVPIDRDRRAAYRCLRKFSVNKSGGPLRSRTELIQDCIEIVLQRRLDDIVQSRLRFRGTESKTLNSKVPCQSRRTVTKLPGIAGAAESQPCYPSQRHEVRNSASQSIILADDGKFMDDFIQRQFPTDNVQQTYQLQAQVSQDPCGPETALIFPTRLQQFCLGPTQPGAEGQSSSLPSHSVGMLGIRIGQQSVSPILNSTGTTSSLNSPLQAQESAPRDVHSDETRACCVHDVLLRQQNVLEHSKRKVLRENVALRTRVRQLRCKLDQAVKGRKKAEVAVRAMSANMTALERQSETIQLDAEEYASQLEEQLARQAQELAACQAERRVALEAAESAKAEWERRREALEADVAVLQRRPGWAGHGHMD